MTQIRRITIFKIPEAAHVKEACDAFTALSQSALKEGKPYILESHATAAHEDPRSQGFNFVAHLLFASKEDMDFYDNECQAHVDIKKKLTGKIGGPPLMLYMDSPSVPN
ncbi:hypothetical protein M011DRAFT_203571 [Sporormia fimetaria CBS 119925]|uniref:Stress-response A/B barrel domain-containing protein n=1 Tax=Sporormia fimetaria CBS 119925 TaxID=1340428 RepID=A0A6A6V2G8_9PLEO|nr:hypothetical protein M011DRAFT_203571 [Sporormia fimetaria CBS 119925]